MGLRLAWDPQEEREGLVDRWIGVSEPVEPLQFAYLNEVSDDRYF